jgi:hypothetical protein
MTTRSFSPQRGEGQDEGWSNPALTLKSRTSSLNTENLKRIRIVRSQISSRNIFHAAILSTPVGQRLSNPQNG